MTGYKLKLFIVFFIVSIAAFVLSYVSEIYLPGDPNIRLLLVFLGVFANFVEVTAFLMGARNEDKLVNEIKRYGEAIKELREDFNIKNMSPPDLLKHILSKLEKTA